MRAKSSRAWRVGETSKRGSRNGVRVFWCCDNRCHSPCTITRITSSTSSDDANSGNSPPQAWASGAIGETSRRGLAMCSNRSVRSACSGVGQEWRTSNDWTSLSVGAPWPGGNLGEFMEVQKRVLEFPSSTPRRQSTARSGAAPCSRRLLRRVLDTMAVSSDHNKVKPKTPQLPEFHQGQQRVRHSPALAGVAPRMRHPAFERARFVAGDRRGLSFTRRDKHRRRSHAIGLPCPLRGLTARWFFTVSISASIAAMTSSCGRLGRGSSNASRISEASQRSWAAACGRCVSLGLGWTGCGSCPGRGPVGGIQLSHVRSRWLQVACQQ